MPEIAQQSATALLLYCAGQRHAPGMRISATDSSLQDFKDLFATLIVSLLPLSAHRVRLTKVEHTFLSEDAINNLGSLKFSQSNRMPDPKDPSRIVTTTTTTTFSMAKDMARSICQRFLEARFIESADGKYQQVYTMKGSVWQLTPKGISILDRFCSRNGIQQKQVAELIGNSLPQLVILEREGQTDKLTTDRGTIEVLFRRFVGIGGFNIKSNVNSADSDSLSDYRDGLTGVKMAAERKVGGKTFKNTFTGKAATDWLMDCSTTVDRRETIEVAGLFVEYELMEAIQQDRAYMSQYPGSHLFQPTKHAIYQLTPRAHDLVNGALSRGRSSEGEVASTGVRPGIARDSNTQRLDKILGDPALRLLFRENLRETHCEENLSFYIDVDEFVRSCKQAIRQAQKNPTSTSMDGIKEIMAQAYGIYNAFLAPGSPCELNIDHQLRSNLATRMTKAVGQDVAMIDTLHEVTALFEDAQNAVFKLMASVSWIPHHSRSYAIPMLTCTQGFCAQVPAEPEIRAGLEELRLRYDNAPRRQRVLRSWPIARAKPKPIESQVRNDRVRALVSFRKLARPYATAAIRRKQRRHLFQASTRPTKMLACEWSQRRLFGYGLAPSSLGLTARHYPPLVGAISLGLQF